MEPLALTYEKRELLPDRDACARLLRGLVDLFDLAARLKPTVEVEKVSHGVLRAWGLDTALADASMRKISLIVRQSTPTFCIRVTVEGFRNADVPQVLATAFGKVPGSLIDAIECEIQRHCTVSESARKPWPTRLWKWSRTHVMAVALTTAGSVIAGVSIYLITRNLL